MTDVFCFRATTSTNITGTRVNSVLRSEEFDNASWTRVNLNTVTADADVGPYVNGIPATTTADRIIENGSVTVVHNVQQSVTTTAIPWTFSVYAKAGTRIRMLLQNATTGHGRMFNLSTGVTEQTGGLTAPTASSIESMGNGWYRCSITMTCTAASNSFRVHLAVANANASTDYTYTGDNASYISVWGAQVEAFNTTTAYIQTGAATATAPGRRARLQNWTIVGNTTAVINLRNGTSAGTVLCTIDVPAGAGVCIGNSLNDEGILFTNGIYHEILSGTITGATYSYS